MTSQSREQASVLLASASSGGTLAALRCLGKLDIGVHVVASTRLAAAAWSRHASRSHLAPPEINHEAFLGRLLAIGKANPGLVLLPTSDQTAWIFAANAKLLAQSFCVYQPSPETVRNILDKTLLAEAAIQVGIDVLPSWDPVNDHELSQLAATLPYPMLIKPRTHVRRLRNDKGIVVETPGELLKQYKTFLTRESYPSVAPADSINRPILQQFAREGSQNVQSVSGFIDRTGNLFVARRSAKIFQRSKPIGVGVCHEALASSPALSKAAYDLCRKLNYFGVFEIEFIRSGGRSAMIDFNPRFYNQIGLDISRGMPLPLLAFLDATGQKEALREAVAKAQVEIETPMVFCDRFTLNSILLAQALLSPASLADLRQWRKWISLHAAHCVDVAIDNFDPVPAFVHALSEIYLGLKALPRFVLAAPLKSPTPNRTVQKVPS